MLRLLILLTIVAAFAQPGIAEEKRSFLVTDSSRKSMALVGEDGEFLWKRPIGALHDVHVLPSGNILFQTSWTRVAEWNPKEDQVVWEYESADSPGNEGKRIEIHAFQRLPDGRTMVAESGPSRIVLVSHDGTIVDWIPLKVENPNPHRDTRLVRVLENGHYLACHEGDGAVREYSPDGRVVWEYRVPLFGRKRSQGHGVEAFGNQCFSAIRLRNGNTLIGTGNGHSIIEVTPAGQIVWSLHQNELPGIQFAWITSLQVLPNGNILINNCHAGPDNPQLIEVNRNKQVVWTWTDFNTFGNALTNSQIVTINGQPVSSAGHR